MFNIILNNKKKHILPVAVSSVIPVAFFLSLQGLNRFSRSPRLSHVSLVLIQFSSFKGVIILL